MLWRRVRDRAGLSAFAALAASQLIRWERGWTRDGWGQVAEKETTRGDLDQARKLVHEALAEQPGNTDFRALADETDSRKDR